MGISKTGRARLMATGALALGLTAANAGGARAEPAISTFTLDNGLRGVVIEDHRAPVATHMVWYRVGSADEPPGQSGVAHFLEHLMFKGTEKIPAGRFSEIVAENGGEDNAFTWRDFTAYFQRVAVDRLPLMMEMEADRMTGLLIDPETVASERDVVLEERSQRTDNDPAARFREQLEATLYLHHPYGVPVIGWRKEIESLDRDKALAFYKRFYAPQNAILVVAGDVDPAQIEEMAKTYYGPIPGGDVYAPPRPQEPPHYAARRVDMQDARVSQQTLYRAYLAPSAISGDLQEAAALDLFQQIIGGGQTSRLYKALVNEGVAVAAGAYYMGGSIDPASFTFYAVPAEGVSLDDLEAKMDAVLADFAANGPTDEELSRAKNLAVADAIYEQDSQRAMAQYYGSFLTMGADLDTLKTWRERMEAVDAEAVRAAAQDLLKIERSVTGRLTAPEKEEVSEG